MHVRLVHDAHRNRDVVLEHLRAVEIIACIAAHREQLEQLGGTVLETHTVQIKLHIVDDGRIVEGLEVGTNANRGRVVDQRDVVFVEFREQPDRVDARGVVWHLGVDIHADGSGIQSVLLNIDFQVIPTVFLPCHRIGEIMARFVFLLDIPDGVVARGHIYLSSHNHLEAFGAVHLV